LKFLNIKLGWVLSFKTQPNLRGIYIIEQCIGGEFLSYGKFYIYFWDKEDIIGRWKPSGASE